MILKNDTIKKQHQEYLLTTTLDLNIMVKSLYKKISQKFFFLPRSATFLKTLEFKSNSLVHLR